MKGESDMDQTAVIYVCSFSFSCRFPPCLPFLLPRFTFPSYPLQHPHIKRSSIHEEDEDIVEEPSTLNVQVHCLLRDTNSISTSFFCFDYFLISIVTLLFGSVANI